MLTFLNQNVLKECSHCNVSSWLLLKKRERLFYHFDWFFFANTFQEANPRVIALTSSRPPACNPYVSISFEGGRGLRLKFPSSIRQYPGESSSGGECSTAQAVKPPPTIHKPRNVLGGPLVIPRGFMRPFTGPLPSTLSIYQGIFSFIIFFSNFF